MLEVVDLSAKAGCFVLSNVSLKVPPSSCHVILGPTGSGKTLLLESVIGLRKPDKGKILVNGDEITHLPMERRRLSYVPQDLALFPHMTVRENILYPTKIRGMRQDTNNGLVKELVDSLGIEHLLDRQIGNLSGGERQRTALARAIASGCRYLILDEPLAALHESLKRELWVLLKNLQESHGVALLMVTHDLEEAFFMGDAISVLIDGGIHQQGEKGEVYNRPRTLGVANFLGIRNIFEVESTPETPQRGPVFCTEINVPLKVSDRVGVCNALKAADQTNGRLLLGIRSENVVLTQGNSSSASLNRLQGTVRRTFDRGSARTLLVQLMESNKIVEIELTKNVPGAADIRAGDYLSFQFPPESLFCIRTKSYPH